MNNFLQHYGLVIVAVIVVLAFIVFAGAFSTTITDDIGAINKDFFERAGVTDSDDPDDSGGGFHGPDNPDDSGGGFRPEAEKCEKCGNVFWGVCENCNPYRPEVESLQPCLECGELTTGYVCLDCSSKHEPIVY